MLTNATKYAPGSPIRVSLARNNGHAVLKIQDFGPGIDVEKQVKLFERFERGVSPRHTSGLGLGLFISRQIMKAHNGLICLTSERGKGATFTIELPLRQAGEIGLAS